METMIQPITLTQWSQLLKDWHIVVTLFYTDGQDESLRMLRLLEHEFEPTLKDFPDTVLVKVPTPSNPELAQSLNVTATPTLMMFHHAELVKRILKNPVSAQQRVDRIVTPYRVLPKDLFDLVADLHRLAKK